MAGKGSRLSRAIQFFEEADLREARAAFSIVNEVMQGRLAAMQPGKVSAKPKGKPGRKPKVAAIKIDDKTLSLGTEGSESANA